MQPQEDYKKLFSELIKKQMLVLGPDITLARVKNVPGVTVDPSGQVTAINGDPQVLLQGLINQFVELSGLIVKKTMESILSNYTGMAALATQGALTFAQPIAPQVAAPMGMTATTQPGGAGTPVAPKDAAALSAQQVQDLNKMLENMNQTMPAAK